VKKEETGPIRGRTRNIEPISTIKVKETNNEVITPIETVAPVETTPTVEASRTFELEDIPRIKREFWLVGGHILISEITVDRCQYILCEEVKQYTTITMIHKENCNNH